MAESVGILGAGALGQALVKALVRVHLHVVICNRRGPESLTALVRSFEPGAVVAGTREATVEPEIIFLAVPWPHVPDALADLPEWNGRILVDATNADASFDP